MIVLEKKTMMLYLTCQGAFRMYQIFLLRSMKHLKNLEMIDYIY